MATSIQQDFDRGDADSLTDLFRSRRLIIAANRGPVTFDTEKDGTLVAQRGAGGLVTALASLAQYADAIWVACVRTEADAVWRTGSLPLGRKTSCASSWIINAKTA